MKKKSIYIILAIIGIGLVFYGYRIFSSGFDIDKTVYLYIDNDKDYNTLHQEIKDSAKIKSISSFDMLALLLDYKSIIRTGRYAVTPEMSVYDLIKDLRSGHQAPVKLKFNNIRTKEDLAQRISEQLMINKETLLTTLEDSTKCKELGFNPQTVVAMFIPNTYEYYWDVTIDNFLQRMKKEYEKFWTNDRLEKAKEI